MLLDEAAGVAEDVELAGGVEVPGIEQRGAPSGHPPAQAGRDALGLRLRRLVGAEERGQVDVVGPVVGDALVVVDGEREARGRGLVVLEEMGRGLGVEMHADLEVTSRGAQLGNLVRRARLGPHQPLATEDHRLDLAATD